MSRSYHKQPVAKICQRGMKQIANRKVRRALNRDFDLHLPYRSYRKYFSSYDICDYRFLVSRDFERYYQNSINKWRDCCCFIKRWRKIPLDPMPDRKEEYRKWMKWYRSK